MEIPQAMLLSWARRLKKHGEAPTPEAVQQISIEMFTYASSSPKDRDALDRNFYNTPEN